MTFETPSPSRPYKSDALVGIIMGSDSDLPVMEEAAKVLKTFGVSYEITVVSAHRTPQRMMDYGTSAAERGLRVIIAGAGGAAHLPGMVASICSLPVIGVPILSSNSIQGIDSLLSIVQMPGGVPVACVGINNAKNAGLLAARMLGISDAEIRGKLDSYRAEQQAQVMEKVADLACRQL